MFPLAQQSCIGKSDDDFDNSTTLNPIDSDITNIAENDETTLNEYLKDCRKLFLSFEDSFSEIRSCFFDCCKTPDLIINSSLYDECGRECEAQNRQNEDENCCVRVCVLKRVDFLFFSTDPNVKPEVNPKALVEIYMNSVNNDPAWEPIVKSSSFRCYSDINDMYYQLACNAIPDNLSHINFCCFKENFLKCPYWNPKKIEKCTICHEYIQECIGDRDDGFFGVIGF